MSKNKWSEGENITIDNAEGKSIVHDGEGGELFSLSWCVNIDEIREIKAIADRAYRIGRDVGRNEKVNEIRRALEIPAGEETMPDKITITRKELTAISNDFIMMEECIRIQRDRITNLAYALSDAKTENDRNAGIVLKSSVNTLRRIRLILEHTPGEITDEKI